MTAERTRRARAVSAAVVLAGLCALVLVIPGQRLLERQLDERIVADIEGEVGLLRDHLGDVAPAAAADPDQEVADLLVEYLHDRSPGDGRVLVGLAAEDLVADAPPTRSDQLVSFSRLDEWSSLFEPRWGVVDDGVGEYRYLAVPVGESATFVAAVDVDHRRRWISWLGQLTILTALAAVVAGSATWIALTARAGAVRAPVTAPRGELTAADVIGAGAVGTGEEQPAVEPVRLLLLEAADLSVEVFDRVRRDCPGAGWRHRADATGDLVCDPDGIVAWLTAALAPDHQRAATWLRMRSVDHAGGVAIVLDWSELDDDDVLAVFADLVGDTPRTVTHVDARPDGSLFGIWVPRRPPNQSFAPR